MVKFGDRMIDMQHAGWEAHYINYEELKLQIDNIEKCQTDEALEAKSDEFLATLKQMLVGVDAFVTDQMSTLQANTDLTDAKSLHNAKAFLKVWPKPHTRLPCMHVLPRMYRPPSREVWSAASAPAPRLSLVPQPHRRRVLPACAGAVPLRGNQRDRGD